MVGWVLMLPHRRPCGVQAGGAIRQSHGHVQGVLPAVGHTRHYNPDHYSQRHRVSPHSAAGVARCICPTGCQSRRGDGAPDDPDRTVLHGPHPAGGEEGRWSTVAPSLHVHAHHCCHSLPPYWPAPPQNFAVMNYWCVPPTLPVSTLLRTTPTRARVYAHALLCDGLSVCVQRVRQDPEEARQAVRTRHQAGVHAG